MDHLVAACELVDAAEKSGQVDEHPLGALDVPLVRLAPPTTSSVLHTLPNARPFDLARVFSVVLAADGPGGPFG